MKYAPARGTTGAYGEWGLFSQGYAAKVIQTRLVSIKRLLKTHAARGGFGLNI